MSYYSITIDGQIYSQNIGYFTTINIYANNINEAINEAIKKIRKHVLHNYKYYTDDFTITDIEKINFGSKQTNYCFYNLF
jgi:hypothetical protein